MAVIVVDLFKIIYIHIGDDKVNAYIIMIICPQGMTVKQTGEGVGLALGFQLLVMFPQLSVGFYQFLLRLFPAVPQGRDDRGVDDNADCNR